MKEKKRILVAALHWGLGHATRCIPIIQLLLKNNFEVILASDGAALLLLQKEFPELESIQLPSYNISYSKHPKFLKWKLLLEAPKFFRTLKAEEKATAAIMESHKVDGIISDNRFGVYSDKVPSVFITHQLQVLSGNTTWLSTKMHQMILKKFTECWVPDYQGSSNLSGKLGHVELPETPIKYIGPLSRFSKKEKEPLYDVLVLLSGPEPQRSLLEEKLLVELKNFSGKTLFVRGVLEKKQTITQKEHIRIYNFMHGQELEESINASALVLSRSGYTTIMDLAKLEKKAFFIPTPGQMEQEYLAKRLDALGIIPFCTQNAFRVTQLERVRDYTGFTDYKNANNLEDLLSLF